MSVKGVRSSGDAFENKAGFAASSDCNCLPPNESVQKSEGSRKKARTQLAESQIRDEGRSLTPYPD